MGMPSPSRTVPVSSEEQGRKKKAKKKGKQKGGMDKKRHLDQHRPSWVFA